MREVCKLDAISDFQLLTSVYGTASLAESQSRRNRGVTENETTLGGGKKLTFVTGSCFLASSNGFY
jgi:hypothetical protein